MVKEISHFSRPIVWYPANPILPVVKKRPNTTLEQQFRRAHNQLDEIYQKINFVRKQQLELIDQVGKLIKKIDAVEENPKTLEGYARELEKKENTCFVFKIMSVLKKCLFSLFCVHLQALRSCSYDAHVDNRNH